MFPGNLLSVTAVVLIIICHHSKVLSMLTTSIILRRVALFIPCTSVSEVAKSRPPKALYPPLKWTREGPRGRLALTMNSNSGAFSTMEDGAQGSNSDDDAFSSQDNCRSQPRPDGASPPSSILARVVPADEPWLTEAGERLRRGKLVAFPTETVYGLGANALSKEAVLKIFKAKQRPLTDPLIVHVPDQTSALSVVDFDGDCGGGEKARRLLALLGEKLWPGPLTLILKAAGVVPSFVTAGTGFVGVRCPAHPVTRQLLSIAGVPVAAPSANRFGHVSPTRADHVMEDLGGSDIMILNGDAKGVCGVGIESTVAKIDVANDRIVVLRMGGVTQARLREVLAEGGEEFATMGVHAGSIAGGKVITMETKAECQDQETETTLERDEAEGQAPGQLLRHYSPDLEVFRVLGGKISTAAATGEVSGMRSTGEPSKFAEMARTSVVIDFAGQLKSLKPVALAYSDLSEEGDTREAAEGLFRALRWAERQSMAQRLLIADLPSESNGDLAAAVNDRIYRAASGKSISFD